MINNNEISTPVFAVEIDGVYHKYGNKLALEKIATNFLMGTTIGIVGPDGVGKSTLLSLIAGVKKLQQGNIKVFGADLSKPNERGRILSRIGYVPQGMGRSLYPTSSVYENIDFHARFFGLGQEERFSRINLLLEATGLASFSDRAASKLSGGMKQKLQICCALVRKPDLLLLDEPTTGVDPLSRQQFWSLVNDLRGVISGITIVVATAYMEEAEEFDYFVAMDAGKILVNDLRSEVLLRQNAVNVEGAYISLLPEKQRLNVADFDVTTFEVTSETAVVEAENLTKLFGAFTAVDDVNFRIRRGEIFGFLGPNGCGKTTTMKMLTGLLSPSSGSAKVLGIRIDEHNKIPMEKIGYMSQLFSLYEELTVSQNLFFHAELFRLEKNHNLAQLIESNLSEYQLKEHADVLPKKLPLGIRQRLQLAVACIHEPELLILDEPTSGVDPIARNMFWVQLYKLSREKKVTIFLTTHFMNEAERCDRVSLMDQGKVLEIGSPKELMIENKVNNMDDLFISYLSGKNQHSTTSNNKVLHVTEEHTKINIDQMRSAFRKSDKISVSDSQERIDFSRIFTFIITFAYKESIELYRDRLRFSFSLIAPVLLFMVSIYAISFDLERIKFIVLDHDRSQVSQNLIDHFSGSRYFSEVYFDDKDIDNEDLKESNIILKNNVQLIIEIPARFGSMLLANQMPEVGIFIDGSRPFLAQAISLYCSAIAGEYNSDLINLHLSNFTKSPISFAPRYVFNQDFRSLYMISPGSIMLILFLFPTMLTALSVIREKEYGSIINFYSSPAPSFSFLLGKQLPYIGISMINFFTIAILAFIVAAIPIHGSFLALTMGAFFFILSSTAFGLLISSLVASQVAAVFGIGIVCITVAMTISGLLFPVSILPQEIYLSALTFPTYWFQVISVGSINKGLGFIDFFAEYLALSLFFIIYFLSANFLLQKQEK